MKKPSTVKDDQGDEVTAALRNSKQVLSPVAPARFATGTRLAVLSPVDGGLLGKSSN